MLDQYPISDLLEWIESESLVLNPEFQRRTVWTQAAKTYLIETILKSKPMPNILIRTVTDLKTRKSIREVVDGQQRLRAIHEFADNKLVLGNRSGEYSRKLYSDLSSEDQMNFLEYRIGVDQLFNADDETVLDIFQRVNSFSYTLNPQELRHAGYSGEFRSAVVASSRKWGILWGKYKVVSLRRQIRMYDDQLMAEIFGIILKGVTDGGQPRITNLYKEFDNDLDSQVEARVDTVLKTVISKLAPALETNLARAPHFLMLFAAVAHAVFGIPRGQIEDMPERSTAILSNVEIACDNLGVLADCLDLQLDDVPNHLYEFRNASSGSTQRISSRNIRFLSIYNALLPVRI